MKYASADDGMLYLQYGDLEVFRGERNSEHITWCLYYLQNYATIEFSRQALFGNSIEKCKDKSGLATRKDLRSFRTVRESAEIWVFLVAIIRIQTSIN
jgi:hypothetical protein